MLHIIQNDPEVPPGDITEHLGVPHLVHHPYRDGLLPAAGDISALIVLGGSMGANDDHKHPFLAELKELIRQIVRSEIPYLGICLGGQLLAAALGAKVESCRWEEIGNFPVTLMEEGERDRFFRDIPREFFTFQWHHDSFDIPGGGTLLATSQACPNQAFRVGDSAWGVQFHPEVTEEIIRAWAAWDGSASGNAEELVDRFNAGRERYQFIVNRLMRNFLAIK
jgi:GMP synthase-like glutamine amidotransferase